MTNNTSIAQVVLVALAISTASFLAMQSGKIVDQNEATEILFQEYKKTLGKTYQTPKEEKFRKDLVVKSFGYVTYINKQELEWTAGLNYFSDLTDEERVSKLGLKAAEAPRLRVLPETSETSDEQKRLLQTAPTSIDWRSKNIINPIKDQQNCGSCWAFSAVGAMEAHWAIKTNTISPNLARFSEQELVDCVYNGDGCNGGWMNTAFNYVQSRGGISTESSYPYAVKTYTGCPIGGMAVTKVPGVVTGIANLAGCTAVKTAVGTIGPVSFAWEVTNSFYSYSKGVYTPSETCTTINHAMVIIGYGSETVIVRKRKTVLNFWLVRNSWGLWGEAGYMRINSDGTKAQQCGLCSYSSYPTNN